MSRVAEILLQMGRTQGDLARQRGQIWGEAVQNISQLPGQILTQHRQQQRLDAQTALEQAREARLRGQEERAADLERQAHADLEDKRYISGKAWATGSFDRDAAVSAATERQRHDLIPEIEETARKINPPPKLVPVVTRDAAGKEVTTLQPETPGLTTATKEPEPPALGTIGAYLMQKRKELGREPTAADIAAATKEFETAKQPTPTITPYQEAELKLQRDRLNKEGQEPIVQIMGPGGVPIWAPRSQAIGQPAAQAPRAVTGAERQSLAFYNRAQDAVTTLTTPGTNGESLEQRMAKQSYVGQGQLAYAPNMLQTSEQQAYRQAQRAFTEARLRKESGAAIPESEFKNDARTYFAQPGDSPATIAQKEKARQVVLDGLKFAAGKAYDEYYGEPNVSPAKAKSGGGSETAKTVTVAELAAIAKRRGTTVDQERARYINGGYAVVK